MTQQVKRKKGVPWFQDYRGASVFSAKKNEGGGSMSGPAAAAASTGSAGIDGDDNASGNGSGGGGSGSSGSTDGGDFFVGWRRRLAVLAEAQRGTLLQLSGVHVTSAKARAAFKVEQDARLRAEASAERADRRRRRRGARIHGSGGGGGTRSRRYGDGRRGASGGSGAGGGVRRGRSDRARRGGESVDSRGKGETEDEVAERNLRAFDRMEYI